jgi:hypothetical protein
MGATTELACWILETLASEPLPAIRKGLYNKATLRTLRQYLEQPGSDKVWAIHLINSMLVSLGDAHDLGLDAGPEIHKLVTVLKDLSEQQFKAEESSPRKSPLLQSVIQASTLGEAWLATTSHHTASASTSKGAEETKDSVEGGAPSWSSRLSTPGVELSDSARLATAAASASEGTLVVAATPVATEGNTTWAVRRGGSGSFRVGLATEEAAKSGKPLGEAPGSLAWGDRLLWYGGKSVPFGPALQTGDVVWLYVDGLLGTVTLYRNKTRVDVAFGPVGSGAAIEVPAEEALGARAYYVSVWLAAGANARILSPETALVPGTASGSSPGAVPAFLETMQEATQYMKAFIDRELPMSVVKKQFLPGVVAKHTVVLESAHPFDSEAFIQEVAIPGAIALEVQFDAQTRLMPADIVMISGAEDQQIILKNLCKGSDPPRTGPRVSVGDMVVRGAAWEWGSEDGGPGGLGEVLEVRSWQVRLALVTGTIDRD